MLRALALSAPTKSQLAAVGTQWVSALEYKFDAEGDPGKSVRLLVAAGIKPDAVFRVLSGVDASWLHSMGAAAILAHTLEPEQIAWLIDPAAHGRKEWH